MMGSDNKQVIPLYMNHGDLCEHQAIVTKVGLSEVNKKNYHWVQVNETIFHPKGGGQPSDEGTIDGLKLAYVHKEISDKSRLDQFEILHCFEVNLEVKFKEGDRVVLKIDPLKRKMHSRLHTAGHLVAEAINKNFPELEGIQGNHYPDHSYVKFKMLEPAKSYDKGELIKKTSIELQDWVQEDWMVENKIQNGIRSIKITQDWAPCGGTHVKNLKEIGQVEILDITINKKEQTVTVKYQLLE